jgi:hyperosmotically inducible protein
MAQHFKRFFQAFALGFIVLLSPACHSPLQPGLFQFTSNDEALTTAVLEGMLDNEETSTLKVHVETHDAVVSLSGYVKTIRQSDTCEALARKTPGVSSVQNNIIVRK